MASVMTTQHDSVIQYIKDFIAEKKSDATLALFLKEHVEFVANNTIDTKGFQNIWINKFKLACNATNFKPKRSAPDWGAVAIAILQADRAPSTTSSASSSSSAVTTATSSPVSSDTLKKLSACDLANVRLSYEKLDPNLMWRLSTGKVVEEKMKIVAEGQSSEHPAHSLIMDPSDPVWQQHFTEEELQEIKAYMAPIIPELPDDLKEFVNSYDDKNTLDDLYDHTFTFKFHPLKQADLFWMQQSVMQALGLQYHQYNNTPRTEGDLLKRVWTFVDSCFDSSEIAVNSVEKASKATSEDQNQGRIIDAFDGIARERTGTNVDMLFSAQLHEFGAAEAGAISDQSSTKSMYELGIKCPKALKDMLVEMERSNPRSLRQLKTCGFILSDLFLQFVMLNCPRGYVCRITKLPDWLQYPTSATSFVADFFPLLHIAWYSKSIMTYVKNAVSTKARSSIPSFSASSPRLLQSSFTHVQNTKKRRRDITTSASTSSSS